VARFGLDAMTFVNSSQGRRTAPRDWVMPPAAVAAALVVFRSYVFVAYEHAHFDSDQAVVGLMAHHLAHLQAFPLFFYGQQYLLAVEAWIAAPFLLVFGTSVTSLKLPLLLMNVAVAVLLVRALVLEAGLTPWGALVPAIFFILPPVVTSSRLVEAQGANIEPFLYVLALWMLRARPVAFGLVLGLGVLHREFTAYAPAALLVLAAWRRTPLTRRAALAVAQAAAAATAVWAAVRLLRPLASDVGEATRPRGLHTVDLGSLPERVATLATDNLTVLFGVRRDALSAFNVTSSLEAGHGWLAWILAATLAVVVMRLAVHARGATTPADPSGLLGYLALVAVQALAAHALVAGGGHMLIRYTLLGLLLPVSLVAAWMHVETSRRLRGAVLAGLTVWTAANTLDHAALLREYETRRPPNVYRELAETLVDRRVTAGRAEYWTAYHITFFTGERVALDAPGFSRIAQYRTRAAETPPDHVVLVSDTPCPGGHRLRHWYLCPP
jgi:hypothetical protein